MGLDLKTESATADLWATSPECRSHRSPGHTTSPVGFSLQDTSGIFGVCSRICQNETCVTWRNIAQKKKKYRKPLIAQLHNITGSSARSLLSSIVIFPFADGSQPM